MFSTILHAILSYVQLHPLVWQSIPVAFAIPVIVELMKKLSGGAVSNKSAIVWTHIFSFLAAFLHWAVTFGAAHPSALGGETLVLVSMANTAYVFVVKNASQLVSEARALPAAQATPAAPAAATPKPAASAVNDL